MPIPVRLAEGLTQLRHRHTVLTGSGAKCLRIGLGIEPVSNGLSGGGLLAAVVRIVVVAQPLGREAQVVSGRCPRPAHAPASFVLAPASQWRPRGVSRAPVRGGSPFHPSAQKRTKSPAARLMASIVAPRMAATGPERMAVFVKGFGG